MQILIQEIGRSGAPYYEVFITNGGKTMSVFKSCYKDEAESNAGALAELLGCELVPSF